MGFGIGMAAMIGGGALSAISTYQQSQTEAAISEYNAAMTRQADVAQKRAGLETERQLKKEMRHRLETGRVQAAARGVQMAGSPLANQLAVIDSAAHDIAWNRYNIGVKSSQLQSQAKLYEMQAESARKAGKLGVASSLVGTVSNVAQISSLRNLYS